MTEPTAGNRPSVTAVIAFLKATGFAHSRYRESMQSTVGGGFYVTKGYMRDSVMVTYREGDAAFDKRMADLGISKVTDMPEDPERAERIKEYAEALAPRYRVEIFGGTSLYLHARETLPARPKGVPTAVTVRKALLAAGVTQYKDGSAIIEGVPGYVHIARVVDQPDHTRVTVSESAFLDRVRAALAAEGWTVEESENELHWILKITGSMPDRRERLRKLRQQREAREIDRAGNAAVAKVEAGIARAKAEQAAEGILEASAGDVVRILADDDTWVEVPRHEPKEAAPAPPALVHYSRAGVAYRVGMRVTYRTRDGFWQHGKVVKIEPDEEGVQRVHFHQDAYQVAPQRRAPKYMNNTPGKRHKGVTLHTDPVRVVALDDKDLSREIVA
ncbi:hypothetical protein ACH4S8_37155 [Streptomyces sp. NPDC021080]|uniref:hypothetical protein n=1 Tax=Streptomyces sp. NPDC021080 TaxID=3365110 RepID=UPI0037921B51